MKNLITGTDADGFSRKIKVSLKIKHPREILRFFHLDRLEGQKGDLGSDSCHDGEPVQSS